MCRDNDLRAAEVITDPKGDRSRRAHEQDDPDLYVRIVSRSDEGIVVRGAKLHITAASLVHELVVMPTKGMRQDETDYAVSFSIPVNTKGVTIINRSFAPARAERVRLSRQRATTRCRRASSCSTTCSCRGTGCSWPARCSWRRKLAQSLGLWERTGGLVGAVAKSRSCSSASPSWSPRCRARSATPICTSTIAELICYAEMLRMSLDYACTQLRDDAVGDGLSQLAGDQHRQILLRGQLPRSGEAPARPGRRPCADAADRRAICATRPRAATSASTCTPRTASTSRPACGSTT